MSNIIPIDDLPLACTYWLQQQIESMVLPQTNTKISGMYSSEAAPILFAEAVVIGEPPVVGVPTLAVWSEAGSQPRQAELDNDTPQSLVAFMYKIGIFLPSVGGDETVSDFELSKQCALGCLTAWLWDTRQTMQPGVYTKADPSNVVKATPPCRPGDWRSVFRKPMSDTKTVPRAIETSYTMQFLISGGYALSAP